MNLRLGVVRLVLSLLSGLCVTLICLQLVLGRLPNGYLNARQTATQSQIERGSEAVAIYRQKTGALPITLKRLSDVPAAAKFSIGSGNWPDSWGRPFIYRVQGQKYQIISLGEDGKPGGNGFNCDLSSDNLRPPEAQIPLWQLVRQPLASGVIRASAICGLLVAIITFFNIKAEDFRRRDWEKLMGQLIFLIIATSFVSVLIASLHIPSH